MQKIVFLSFILVLAFFLVFGCTAQANTGDTDITSQEQGVDGGEVSVDENPLSGTCPFGKMDAECTGECGQFVDNGKDGFCDRAQ